MHKQTLIKLFATTIQIVARISCFGQNSPATTFFAGKAGKSLAETTPGNRPFNPVAPKNAPNIVYILLDDVGFGASSTFGGLVETPTFDSLANNGLRYTNFSHHSHMLPYPGIFANRS